MILVCPFCGQESPHPLIDGLASCNHCNRIYDGSLSNRLLSASWLVKKSNYHGIEQLISDTKLPEHEAILVYSFMIENCYSYDDFKEALVALGIK
jgi:hypothetical protein